MKDQNQIILNLAARIRDVLTVPSLAGGPGIDALAREFIDWCSAQPQPQRQAAIHHSDAVLSLFAAASATQDVKTVQHCLRAMVRSGRFGRMLAARFINGKALSLPALSPKIALWPAQDRLALIHEMLSDYPGDNDRDSLTWLENLLKPLMAADPMELAPFVERLGDSNEPLAFPAKHAILNGLFGNWLDNRLADEMTRDELHQVCRIIRGLDEPRYVETMAEGMQQGRFSPDAYSLRTIAAVGEGGNKAIMNMLAGILSSADPALAGPCLDAIIAQGHPSTGKLLASARTLFPGIRQAITSRAPLLGDTAYVQYIKGLPEEQRETAHLEMHRVLQAIAPDYVRNTSRDGRDRHRVIPSPLQEAAYESPPVPVPPEQPPSGFLSRLIRGRPKTLEAMLPKMRNVRDLELPFSMVGNQELKGREFIGLGLSASVFSGTAMLLVKIAGTVLKDAGFHNCTAEGVTFSDVDFTNAAFRGTNFSKCAFNNCILTKASFTDCTFDECRFRGCAMGETAFQHTDFTQCGLTVSSLAGASFYNSKGRTTRFEAVDLECAELLGCDFRGVEFISCTLHAVNIRDCRLLSVTMPRTTVTRSVIKNSDAAHPLFLANRVRQMTIFAREIEQSGIPAGKAQSPRQAKRTMSAWSRELTFMRRERFMLENNRTRLFRAMNIMTRNQQNFVRLLPLLLDSDLFDKQSGIGQTLSCRVWGYYPGQTTLELAQYYFSAAPQRDSSPDVRILALYAMGSMGTVAQSVNSDLDCWVCYDGDLSISMENGLKRKLDAMTEWAESTFGLEAHFYPMRMDDVRDNRFASGDEESSGSAQALLLKEEFYRTALRLAGKNLAWWVTPAGVTRKGYESYMRSARRYPHAGKPRLEDFGHLAPVPPDEYFGGALWQIVKAVRAPFKSILKLGLLETYASSATGTLPLCDRIKRNLQRNRKGKPDTDPYTALFRTLFAYYRKRGQEETASLLKDAFRLKANLTNFPFFMNLPTRPEDLSVITVLFGTGYVEPDRITGVSKTWPFAKSLKIGGNVRQYMVETYKRIQSGMTVKTKALISPEDLTRMGRRIGTNFSKKPYKINRVPLIDTNRSGFALLHFSAEKGHGKQTVWTVRGGGRGTAMQNTQALQPLHRSLDPATTLAWLLANRLYHPRGLIQTDRSMAPIAAQDLQRAMAALYDFFPFEKTFERDINEGLQPERIARLFLILNLTSGPATRNVEQATAIYATNWGELFCRTFHNPGESFAQSPSLFLGNHLDQSLDADSVLHLFTPKGSQCKRIAMV